MVSSLLVPIFLAFAYRCRGGAIPLGSDTLARIVFWAIPVGIVSAFICYFQHIPLWIAPICSIMAFAGACMPHSQWQDGMHPLQMGMTTFIMLTMIITPMAIMGNLYFLYFIHLGFLSSLAYWLGYKYPFNIKYFVVGGDASVGEFLTGAFAFGLPLSLLLVI